MTEQAVKTKHLLQEVIARCTRSHIPVQAVLELTYRCNLRCGHCYVDRPGEEELSAGEWEDVFGQLKAAGAMYLLFTGGEVMVRRDFLEIAGSARRQGFMVGLLTNCTLVTPDIAREIAGLKPFSIATSLYGATAPTHERITGVPGSFRRALRGIERLVSRGMTPLVQTLVMNHNYQELEEVKKLVAGLGAVPVIDLGLVPSKMGECFPFRYEASEDELLGCSWQPPKAGDVVGEGWGLCKAGKGMCSISPGGDVYPCPSFHLKLGNIRRTDFNVLWSVEPCAELRYLRSVRRTDLYACNQCELMAYCHRCAGVAYAESGRPDGPSSTACRQARMRWRLSQAREEMPCPKNHTSNRS